MGEITALFKENGIHMTIEQVADMFADAQRNHLDNLSLRFQ